MLGRILSLAAGTILGVVGLLLLVLPGPGVLVLAVAGGFFASESLSLARMLDRLELAARTTWRRWRSR